MITSTREPRAGSELSEAAAAAAALGHQVCELVPTACSSTLSTFTEHPAMSSVPVLTP